jgi:hypothetical protein
MAQSNAFQAPLKRADGWKGIRMKKKFAGMILSTLVMLVWGCAPKVRQPAMDRTDHLMQLADYLTGSFTSLNQSILDPEYMEIRLHMVRIWNERADGYWIYVEQAVADKKPYRQRVYHLTQLNPSLFESRVLTFEKPEDFAGAWKHPELFDAVTPESLKLREGCEIVLRWEGDHFTGSTIGKTCKSDLRGAAYASSEAYVSRQQLKSWDRGFDTEDKQIWGAEKGPYIFDKIKDYPL